jgi:acetaldehyde dehydrogenase/alcohol dehydrogenase
MWVLYEHPEVPFEDLVLGVTDLNKRILPFPKLRKKATLVTVPTTSGSGADVSPAAVIRNAENNTDYIIVDYELTPDIAIADPSLVMDMPKALTAASGMEAVSHALESYVSAGGSDYTGGQALEALRLLFKHLPSAYAKGAQDPLARAKVHYAASLSGLAFSNSFLGLAHGMAHALGVFEVPLGIAQGIFLPHVIGYNRSRGVVRDRLFRSGTPGTGGRAGTNDGIALLAPGLRRMGALQAAVPENLVS